MKPLDQSGETHYLIHMQKTSHKNGLSIFTLIKQSGIATPHV